MTKCSSMCDTFPGLEPIILRCILAVLLIVLCKSNHERKLMEAANQKAALS